MKLPKIGKRGWLGVIVFAASASGFITARSQAEKDFVEYAFMDQHSTYLLEINAEKAGYANGTDFMAHENRVHGVEGMAVGSALIIWGFNRYNGKKPENIKPTA